MELWSTGFRYDIIVLSIMSHNYLFFCRRLSSDWLPTTRNVPSWTFFVHVSCETVGIENLESYQQQTYTSPLHPLQHLALSDFFIFSNPKVLKGCLAVVCYFLLASQEWFTTVIGAVTPQGGRKDFMKYSMPAKPLPVGTNHHSVSFQLWVPRIQTVPDTS